MKNVTLRLSSKNIWENQIGNKDANGGKQYFYMAFDGDTYANKEEIKKLGFKWNDVHWVKKIEAQKENIKELAETIKTAVEAGAEFESLARGVSYEAIMKQAGI